MLITVRSRIERPEVLSRSSGMRKSPRGSAVPAVALQRTKSPSRSMMATCETPNRRNALCAMASNTGCASSGVPAMTRRISLVAVCCSNASVSSRVRACTSSNSRVFSMAITAWSAKVSSSSICF